MASDRILFGSSVGTAAAVADEVVEESVKKISGDGKRD
jgi:hypothetical protein